MSDRMDRFHVAFTPGAKPPRLKRDLTGDTFGALTVVGFAGRGSGGLVWFTVCECGAQTAKYGHHMTTGRSTSCGCLRIEKIRAAKTRHGARASGSTAPEYAVWRGMLDRCHNPLSHAYKDYGGRGIDVCERWRNSYEAFVEDMGTRPDDCTIDRVDNNRGYEPENCRWASRLQQAQNKRNVRLYQFNGAMRSLSEIERLTGIRHQTLHKRLRRGMPIEQAAKTEGPR